MIKLLKFLYEDLKTDVQFIIHWLKCTVKGKPVLREEFRQDMKQQWAKQGGTGTFVVTVIREYWIMLLMMWLFFVAGMWYAEQQCQSECNEFIVENYHSQPKNYTPKLNYGIVPNLTIPGEDATT